MNKLNAVFLLIFIGGILSSQTKPNDLTYSSDNSVYGNNKSASFSELNIKKSEKSPFLGFLLGLAVPGLGHIYADRLSGGKYFMITESAVWITYAAMTFYGNWLLDDAYSFAVNYAGISLSGKDRDDIFFTHIANYNSLEEYNNERLRFGEYDKVYLPNTGFDFRWQSEEMRKKYREDKIAGDRTLNDRLFAIGAAVINHLISGISAVFAVNSYNKNLRQKSGGFHIRASVIRNGFNKADGIMLNLTKRF